MTEKGRTGTLAFAPLGENQLRQLVDADATWRAYSEARREAAEVRGTMFWRELPSGAYLVRQVGRKQTSLGVRTDRTEAIFSSFMARRDESQARFAALKKRLDEQRKLNRLYRLGRVPTVVVRTLAALEDAGLADKFLVVGTHAVYAYESAAGVLVSADTLATQDLDLLFDARKRIALATTLEKTGAKSLIGVLRKADPSFRVRRDQLQTAVNDSGFEVDIIRRVAVDGDPHPLRMSDTEDDLWAVQVGHGEKLASARRFEQLVIATSGEMATMRTVHPLDFIRLKTELSRLRRRDPRKAPKDRLQAMAVRQLWDDYLSHLGDGPAA